MENIKRFRQITQDMANLYEKKNADYGNSFEQSLDEFGMVAGLVRIGDKFNRIKNIMDVTNGVKFKPQVTEETIKDTLIDMANYCIMLKMWLDKEDKQ